MNISLHYCLMLRSKNVLIRIISFTVWIQAIIVASDYLCFSFSNLKLPPPPPHPHPQQKKAKKTSSAYPLLRWINIWHKAWRHSPCTFDKSRPRRSLTQRPARTRFRLSQAWQFAPGNDWLMLNGGEKVCNAFQISRRCKREMANYIAVCVTSP